MKPHSNDFTGKASAIALLVAASAFSLTTTASAEQLSGPELKERISGRTVYLAAPLGGEMPLRYSPNGTVDGNGTAVGLGRLFAARETGRWFMRGNMLCQQFPTWYKGERLCFTVRDLGNNRIRWNRDNGETGLARIGG
ncbi:MAG: hypothetical protein ACRCWF_11165 [Beijerinckiaceae bacterium]